MTRNIGDMKQDTTSRKLIVNGNWKHQMSVGHVRSNGSSKHSHNVPCLIVSTCLMPKVGDDKKTARAFPGLTKPWTNPPIGAQVQHFRCRVRRASMFSATPSPMNQIHCLRVRAGVLRGGRGSSGRVSRIRDRRHPKLVCAPAPHFAERGEHASVAPAARAPRRRGKSSQFRWAGRAVATRMKMFPSL